MGQDQRKSRAAAPLGYVEPHAPMLRVPASGQILYKIMTVENLLRSIDGQYLHFNRVDKYSDFPGADPHDGQQLPMDQPGNAASPFKEAPDFSAAHYYDKSRSRTYACCFSLENSDYIWNSYATSSTRGKVCIALSFDHLRSMLNGLLQSGAAKIKYNGAICEQIFSINYGIVGYVDWASHKENSKRLPNPVTYTYLKDRQRFEGEKELRLSLSAIGLGEFSLRDGSIMQFPESLRLTFDYKAAIENKTIQEIQFCAGTDAAFLFSELEKRNLHRAGAEELSVSPNSALQPTCPASGGSGG